MGVDERYAGAVAARDLSLCVDREGAADVLVAAGWCRSRVGAGLLRLRSEWGAVPKPVPSVGVSKAAAQAWYAAELAAKVSRLRSLPDVRDALAVWVAKRCLLSAADARAVVLVGLAHWLSPTCAVCQGRRWSRLEGAPVLSARACPACAGQGHARLPGGEHGRVLADHVDCCLGEARVSIGKRLRGSMNRG